MGRRSISFLIDSFATGEYGADGENISVRNMVQFFNEVEVNIPFGGTFSPPAQSRVAPARTSVTRRCWSWRRAASRRPHGTESTESSNRPTLQPTPTSQSRRTPDFSVSSPAVSHVPDGFSLPNTDVTFNGGPVFAGRFALIWR